MRVIRAPSWTAAFWSGSPSGAGGHGRFAAVAVGASRGFIYIRAEYTLAIENLRGAIEQAQRHPPAGPEIVRFQLLSSRWSLRVGAGPMSCGEETALIHSIEGKRGTPRPRPPYPAEQGVGGLPTLINNVETFANVVPILREGSDWYAAIGTNQQQRHQGVSH